MLVRVAASRAEQRNDPRDSWFSSTSHISGTIPNRLCRCCWLFGVVVRHTCLRTNGPNRAQAPRLLSQGVNIGSIDSGTSLFGFIKKKKVDLSIARARLAWTCPSFVSPHSVTTHPRFACLTSLPLRLVLSQCLPLRPTRAIRRNLSNRKHLLFYRCSIAIFKVAVSLQQHDLSTLQPSVTLIYALYRPHLRCLPSYL